MNFLPIFNTIWITLPIIIGGDPAIILLSFASTGTNVSLVTVIIVGYLSTVMGDIIWFSIIKKISATRIKRWKFIGKVYDAYVETGNKIGQKTPLKMLFLGRSFYGGGLATIIYLAGTPLSIKKLIKYSLLVNAFWVTLSVFLGWAAGKGFKRALQLFVDTRIAITIMAVLIIVFYVIFYKLKKNKKCRE